MKASRTKVIVRTSVIGIAANLLLVIFKMIVGIVANSIAFILDAINNLSDALSSIITIVGIKLSGKAPDKKHPFGHGRIEYVASMLVAFIVLAAGVTAIKESIDKIIHPQESVYGVWSIVVVCAAIVIKFVMGLYVRGVGRKISSQALVASGTDAFFDAVLSIGTLIAVIVRLIWGVALEGWIGLIISAIIIKAGVDILSEVFNTIIGTRADEELVRALKETVNSFDGVLGVYDLVLHNYGPTRIIGSAHIEVDEKMTAKEIHELTRGIVHTVAEKHGVLMTIGVYAANVSSPKYAEMKEQTDAILAQHREVLQMHGFYVDEIKKAVMFDIIVDFGADAEKTRAEIIEKLTALYPDYTADVVLDADICD